MNKIRKVFSTALAFFIVLGTVTGDMSVINAQDGKDYIVTLDTDKKEISIGDMITVNAIVNMPDDANIISYEWASDKEDVAIVSANDNVASVEAKATGKVKISVVVNYEVKIIKEASKEADEEDEVVKKTATAEVELTVQEKEEKITAVESTKEADVEEVTDTTLDPVTEQYIKDHVDPAYAKAEKSELCNAILIKQTLADADKLKTGETIDSVMAREEFAEVIYTMITASSALYNTDDNSAYYVAYANTMQKDKSASVKDVIFALYDTEGHKLNDCHYDMNTGLVYIPKSYLNKNGKEELMKVQVQFLQAITKDVDDLTSKVQLTTTEDDDVKTGSKNLSVLDLETNVKTETGLSKSEMTVAVNGIPLKDGAYSYNSKTGIVSIPSSSCSIQSVSIDIQEKSVASKIVDRLFDIQEVNAAMTDAFGQPLESAGTIKLPDGTTANSTFMVDLRIIYKDDINEVYGNLVAPYGFVNDGAGGIDLTNKIYYQGGEVTSPIVPEPRDINLAVDIAGFWDYSATSGKSSIVPLRCCHISNPMGTNNGEDKVRPVFVRILNKYDGEALIGFMTPQVYGQTGAAFIKFDVVPEKGNISIEKSSSNSSLTNGNDCYSLKDAVYELKDGSNNTVATLTTDENGKASAQGIKAGNYTLVETQASKGYELNTDRTYVTIVAGQTTTVSGRGCVVETPANDPVSIEITKADIVHGASIPQGAASLEGAEFTVKYYNALYDKISDLPNNSTRTWVVKTIKQTNGTYRARLDTKYLVSGDTLYTDEYGTVTLPIGTITIQETKAPKGYLLDGATLVDGNGSSESIDNGVYLTQIRQNDNGGVGSIIAGNYPIVKDEVITGKITVTKKSSKTGEKVTIKPTVFGIYANTDMYIEGTLYSERSLIQKITTNNGKATSRDLPYGNYLVKEENAPEGFVLTLDKKIGKITNNGDIYELSFSNVEKTGSVTLHKKFANTVTGLTGDATLKGNTYILYADEDIKDPSNDEIIYSKNEAITKKNKGSGVYGDVGKKTTNEQGDITWTNLPLGKYYAVEYTSNDSLLLNTEKVTFEKLTEKNPDQEETISQSSITKDFIKEQRLNIFKEGMGKTNVTSGRVEGLNGATFEIKLKNDVEKSGWDNAPLYDTVTTSTDSNGNKGYATTKALPFGVYILKETVTPEGYDTSPLIIFEVKNDEIHTNGNEQHITVNDELRNAYVRIVKKDSITNKNVTFSSAVFRIKNKITNEYVIQKVGNMKYSYFTTNSDNVIIGYNSQWASGYDVPGTIITPLLIGSGEYEIEEILTPNGFLELEAPVSFKIGDVINMTDEEGYPIIEVVVKNEQPTAIININKSIVAWDQVDKNFVETSDLSGIQFELIAKTEVQDDIDGSVIYKEGEVVGTYSLKSDGTLSIGNLPIDRRGTTYVIKEVKTLDGLVLNDKEYKYEFKQKDMTTKVYKHTFDIKNDTTKVEVSKRAVTGQDELKGATLTVTDKDGNIVDEWVSGDQTHHIQGLKVGETYTLTEKITPHGYVKAASIDFIVANNGTVQKIDMIDNIVSFFKTDVTGEKEVEGAKIEVKEKETGKIVDEWISGKDVHHISGLEVGKTYILNEITAPDGYVKASDIVFVAGDDNNHIVMIDKQVIVNKIDQTNKTVTGAKIQILDVTTNEVVEEWVTDGKEHPLSNVELGKSYILHEVKAPENYQLADDIEFSVIDDNKNQIITMVDNRLEKVLISKKDITTKEELPGATLKITDENNRTVEEWVSKESPHYVWLVIGKRYQLTETIAPDGYAVAETIKFDVDDNGDIVQQVIMYDELLPAAGIVHTGDSTNILMYFILFIISGLFYVFLNCLRNKKKNTRE